MAIARRSYSVKVDDRGVDNIPLALPAGTTAGDMMYAFLGNIAFAPTSVTGPAGWVKLAERNNPGTDNTTGYVYQKVATSSEPATFTWTFGNNGKSLGAIVSYSGVDTAAAAVIAVDGWVDPPNTVTTPGITLAAGDWLATYQFGRQSPSTAAVKSWTNSTGTDQELVDNYNQDGAARLGTHALWDTNTAQTAGIKSRTITSSVNIQQVTVYSLRIPMLGGSGPALTGPNIWNSMASS